LWTETVVLTGKRNPTRHTKEIGFHLRLSSTLLGVARIRPGCQANFPGVVTPSRPDAKLQTLIVAMESVSLSTRTKSWLRLRNWNQRFVVAA